MKSSLRRSLAVAIGTVALAVGLGVPTAGPAAAASCADLSSIKGAVTQSVARGTAVQYRVDSTITTTATGCSSSRTWYVLQVTNSAGTVILSLNSRDASSSRSGTTSYDTYIGAGTTAYTPADESLIGFTVKAYNASLNGLPYVVAEQTWGVFVPNDGYDSATGDDVLTYGQSCPSTIRGSYC